MPRIEAKNPWQILEVWGLRVSGGTLKNPMPHWTGGDSTIDEDLVLVDWVESTEGFEQARSVLQHVFAYGQPFATYQYRNYKTKRIILAYHRITRKPTLQQDIQLMETMREAALRHGQVETLLENADLGWRMTDGQLAELCLFEFLVNIYTRRKTDPIRLCSETDTQSPDTEARRIAQQAIDVSERKYPSRFKPSESERKPRDLRNTGYQTRHMRRGKGE